MLKISLIIIAMFLFYGSIIIAQEKPEDFIENAQRDSSVEITESADSSVIIKSIELKIWNKVCPVMGNKIDPDGPTVEYNGKLYGFCCPGCDAKFEKNPEKYSKNLSEDGKKFVGKK